MSASREKKARAGATHVQRRNSREEERARQKKYLYGIMGGVLACLAAALLIWDSGFFQKRAVAVTIDGKDYPTAVVQYYYENVAAPTMYYAQMGLLPNYDPTVSPKKQVMDPESGQTWHDYFLEEAIIQLKQLTALTQAAEQDNYILNQEQQAYLDKTLQQLKTAWRGSGRYSSLSGYIQANYGEYMTEETLTELLTQQITATAYQQEHQKGLVYTEQEIDTYYQEHANELDTFQYSVFVLEASVPPAQDENGNTVEQSQEERQAALEAAKGEVYGLAQEIQQKLSSGTSPQEVEELYRDQLYSAQVEQIQVGSGLATAPYSGWLFDPVRQTGQVSIQENDLTDVYQYQVIQFHQRSRDEAPTADVRHILVGVSGSAPDDAQLEKAKEKAQEILDTFQASGGGEEAFGVLAVEYSADPGSQASGGLYEGISPQTGFIPAFTEWALDPTRQPGDTGLIENLESQVKGWHVMYFSGWNYPVWKLTAKSAIGAERMNQWIEELTQGLSVVQGQGINYI